MTVGERIRETRKQKGMTQKELAGKLGVSYVVISQYERGERNPKRETLRRIASALGVIENVLVGIDEDSMNYRKWLSQEDTGEPPRKPYVSEIHVESDGTISPLGRFYEDNDRYEELETLLKSEADESRIEAYKKEMQEINLRILSYAPEVQAQMQGIVDVIGKMFKGFDWKTIARIQQDNLKGITDQFSELMKPASETALIGFQDIADYIKDMKLDALTAANDEADDDPDGDLDE